jgi:hypothetical protein
MSSANQYQLVTGGENLKDVVIQIDTHVEQSSRNGDYGVICRYQDDENMYLFEITQDAYYAIFKMDDAELVPLINFTYSDLLVDVKDAKFEVACIGDTLSFVVNGKLMGEVTDNSFKAGDYGFFAGTFDSGGNLISFDNVIISQP